MGRGVEARHTRAGAAVTHTADHTDRQENATMTSLIGVWKSTDKRENRHIYVTRVDSGFAYGRQCSANGMSLPKARETRVRLNANRDGLARYSRPKRSSVGGTTTSSEEQA